MIYTVTTPSEITTKIVSTTFKNWIAAKMDNADVQKKKLVIQIHTNTPSNNASSGIG